MDELRVLVVAPFGRDADEIRRVLADAGYSACICPNIEQVCARIDQGAAAALVAEEALSDSARRQISETLAKQPAWSDFPLLLLISRNQDKGHGWNALRGLVGTSHFHLLIRPLSTATLLTAVQTAIRSRERQYQVREELARRLRDEEALRKSEARLRHTLSGVKAGIWDWHVSTGTIHWSPEAFDLFGLDPTSHSPTYEDWHATLHPDDRDHANGSIRQTLAERHAEWSLEYRVVHPERGVRWLLGLASIDYDAEGKPLRMSGVNIDITEKKRVEETLVQLNESLELRVAERTAESEQRSRDLRRLTAELSLAEHRERQRLAKLLHDELQQLLVAARLRLPDRFDLPPEQLAKDVANVDALLQDCLLTSRNLSRELSPTVLQQGSLTDLVRWLAGWFSERYGLSVKVQVPASVPSAPEHLRVFVYASLRELLLNVIKHSGKMEADVWVRFQDGHLAIQVDDEGRSFDPAAVERGLHDPQSFGLFNLAERLVALGGRLEIKNTAGGGASIGMVIPWIRDRAASTGPAWLGSGQARSGSPGSASHQGDVVRLVIVDDHEVVREGFTGLFNQHPDFQVVGVGADGIEAIARADALRPDAIIMDVTMPTLDGIEATRRIKQRHPEIAIIGLSLHEEEGIRREMMEAGASAFLSKHAPARDLVDSIRRALTPAG